MDLLRAELRFKAAATANRYRHGEKSNMPHLIIIIQFCLGKHKQNIMKYWTPSTLLVRQRGRMMLFLLH
jgi:hypothetical protein